MGTRSRGSAGRIPRSYPQIRRGRDGGQPGWMARRRVKGDAVPSDKRADKARRPDGPVPSGAGGGSRMAVLSSLDRRPACLRSAVVPCEPGATRAALPDLRIGPETS